MTTKPPKISSQQPEVILSAKAANSKQPSARLNRRLEYDRKREDDLLQTDTEFGFEVNMYLSKPIASTSQVAGRQSKRAVSKTKEEEKAKVAAKDEFTGLIMFQKETVKVKDKYLHHQSKPPI